MIKHTLIKKFLAVLMLSAFLIYFGCEKKAENSKQTQQEVTSETISPDSTSSVATESEPGNENKIQIPDIKGTWTGTFDKRATTLKITEQTDSSFSGKITINYREVINQEVKGTISPSTGKISMKDQLHSRYQGKYNGKLSEEGNNFSGTFTMDLDGKKFTFNLNKK
jgi:predicted membrane protein